MQNLFELSPEEKERWLRNLAELMGVWEDWRLLAAHGERLLPLAPQVAQSTWQRLVASSFTQGVAPALEALEAIAQIYFNEPTLDATYLEKRARAGSAYLQAGLGPAQTMSVGSVWIDEWNRTFAHLFPEDPSLQARLNRALAQVAFFNAAVIMAQYAYEAAQAQRRREEELLEKFLRAVGISRELYEQMAKAAGEV
jgi:hypothetical protein